MGYALIGRKGSKYTVLSVHDSEDAAEDAAGDFIDDRRYDLLYVAEFITKIG